ncbi:MAG: PAS domain-containing protein [Deltaproteobacteria bacterium]|nr:PAS domain-containing protein [Deltaproteobacteria bacterium]
MDAVGQVHKPLNSIRFHDRCHEYSLAFTGPDCYDAYYLGRLTVRGMASYEDILENLSEGLIAVDIDGRVSVFNQSAEKMAGVSRSLVIGKQLKDAFRRDERLVEMLTKTLREGRLFAEYEEKLHRRLGGTLPVGITTSQVFDADGNVTGASALIKDLSGIKSLEAGSLRKERLAYIGTFAANLAHEIRNPLSGIRGAAQLLAKKVKDESLADYMRVIMKEADRLNLILNDMLDFARPARLDRKPLNIHKVLDSVALLLKDGMPPDAFVRAYDPSIPDVLGDENQLTQVFLNLVKNAKEALGKKGEIRLTTRIITEFHLIEDGSASGKMVSVEVRDNGCGIKEEDLEKIFTPFFTTKPKGSGLGMAITLKIIKEHNGLLKIDSTPGEGTTVTVCLPIAEG